MFTTNIYLHAQSKMMSLYSQIMVFTLQNLITDVIIPAMVLTKVTYANSVQYIDGVKLRLPECAYVIPIEFPLLEEDRHPARQETPPVQTGLKRKNRGFDDSSSDSVASILRKQAHSSLRLPLL
jgi:hypothetical protein